MDSYAQIDKIGLNWCIICCKYVAEYVVNGCKRATVQFYYMDMFTMLYLHNDIFLTDIIGYDRLKFS